MANQDTNWFEEENEGKSLNKKVLLIALSIFIFSLSGILFFFTSNTENSIEGEDLKAHVLSEIGITRPETEKEEKDGAEEIKKEEVTKEDVIPEGIFNENGDFVFTTEIFKTYSNEKIEEIFRKMLNDKDSPIIAIDTGSVINFATNDYLELVGFSAEELMGKTFFEIINPEDLQSMLSSITQLSIKGNPTKIGPFRITTKAGVTQMHIANAIILKDKDENPQEIVLAIENVSDKISEL